MFSLGVVGLELLGLVRQGQVGGHESAFVSVVQVSLVLVCLSRARPSNGSESSPWSTSAMMSAEPSEQISGQCSKLRSCSLSTIARLPADKGTSRQVALVCRRPCGDLVRPPPQRYLCPCDTEHAEPMIFATVVAQHGLFGHLCRRRPEPEALVSLLPCQRGRGRDPCACLGEVEP